MLAYSAGELISIASGDDYAVAAADESCSSTRSCAIMNHSSNTDRHIKYGSLEISTKKSKEAAQKTSDNTNNTDAPPLNAIKESIAVSVGLNKTCCRCRRSASLADAYDDDVPHFLVCSRRRSSTLLDDVTGHDDDDNNDKNENPHVDNNKYDPKYRFLVLFLISLVPFGGHFFKSSISSLEVFMLHDDLLGMNSTRYGILVSSFAFGNFFLAIFGGHYIDKVDDKKGIMLFISLVLIGELIFTLSLQIKSYYLLLIGGIIFGSSQGVVSVAHRAIVSRYFADYEIIFAIGWTHGVACLSKMAARACVVPIADLFNSYIAPFYCMIIISLLSFLAAYAYTQLLPSTTTCNSNSNSNSNSSNSTNRLELKETTPLKEQSSSLSSSNPQDDDFSNDQSNNNNNCSRVELGLLQEEGGEEEKVSIKDDNGDDCPAMSSLLEFDCSTLSTVYWLLSILHSLYLMVFHLFPNISGHFLHERHGMTPEEAGYISSFLTVFAIFGAPLTGYILDKNGGQLYIILLAGTITILSYGLISFTYISPLYSILALSIADACIPTILHALLPLSVDISQFGVAFGISEVLDASGNILGNITVGYLREKSGSYVSPMIFIICVSAISIFLSIILIFHDKIRHNSFFNSAMKKC